MPVRHNDTVELDSKDLARLHRVSNPGDVWTSEAGDFTPWLTEVSPTWINLHDNLRPAAGGTFLWTSERGGLARLMRGTPGQPDGLHPVSPPDLHVTSLLGTAGETAWVQGWRGNACERHLFRIDLGTGSAVACTAEPGWHEGVVHPGSGQCAFVFSSTATLPTPEAARSISCSRLRRPRAITFTRGLAE